MASIIRNVSEIEGDERSVLEGLLGRKLQDDQQLIVSVVTVGAEPSADTRDSALDRAAAIARKGRTHAAEQRITPQQADAAIDEAIQHARQQKT